MRKPHSTNPRAARRKARRKELARAAAQAALHGGGDPSPVTVRLVVQIGIALTIALVMLTVLTAIATGGPQGLFYWKTLWLVIAHLGGGSLMNAGAGLEMKVPTWFVIMQSFLQDAITVCFVYALFAWGYKRFAHWPVVGQKLDAAHKAALEHSDVVRPYGVIGLIVFVLLPLWATGPIVATVMGYILGLGAFTTLITVNFACLLCTLVYVYFYGVLANWNPGVAIGLLGVMLGITVLGILYGAVRFLWSKDTATPPLQD
jgi:uncharacterized membrane protein